MYITIALGKQENLKVTLRFKSARPGLTLLLFCRKINTLYRINYDYLCVLTYQPILGSCV